MVKIDQIKTKSALTWPEAGKGTAAGRPWRDARRDKVQPQTAGGRDKVWPQAGRTCEQGMLSSYPASIVCLRAKHGSSPKYAFGERIHARKAWFETKVCIRRENSCTQDMPHASIPARGARGSDGGVGGGLKKKTRITTKARCTHLWRHSELLS